jgi:hypothetical protein
MRTAIAGIVVLLAGCTVTGTTEPVGYAEVTSVPVDVYYGYPQTTYDGRTVYWVDNRWIYRDRDRWLYYRTEPPPLYHYRQTVRQAPPAPRYEPRYEPRPRYDQRYPTPAPAPAPPATRVR